MILKYLGHAAALGVATLVLPGVSMAQDQVTACLITLSLIHI